VKAVPQPQLKPKPNAPAVPEVLLAQFQADNQKWLTLNSNLPRLIDCRTVGELEAAFEARLHNVRDFIYYVGSTTMDWRVLNVYLYYCDANGNFLPDRTIDQNGRIKRQGGGIWSGLKKESTKKEKKENTDLVGHYLTRETRRETADQTIATYLGMTQEEKERELRRILISMDLILEVAEKKKCWRAAAMYLKMVDYDGSFLPMSSAARDRWEKTYGRYVDNWEKLEKQQAEKAEKAKKAERVVSSPAKPKLEPVQQEISLQNSESKIIDSQLVVNENSSSENQETDGISVGSLPVSPRLVAQAEALAAERARQAREEKLNAAIPGRKFRKQGKVKPGALTPGPNSTTYNPKGQPTGPSKGKNHNQKGSPTASVSTGFNSKDNQPKNIDYQINKIKIENNQSKAPP
jgi:hypothetical protein